MSQTKAKPQQDVTTVDTRGWILKTKYGTPAARAHTNVVFDAVDDAKEYAEDLTNETLNWTQSNAGYHASYEDGEIAVLKTIIRQQHNDGGQA
jgi:hypothetical protein